MPLKNKLFQVQDVLPCAAFSFSITENDDNAFNTSFPCDNVDADIVFTLEPAKCSSHVCTMEETFIMQPYERMQHFTDKIQNIPCRGKQTINLAVQFSVKTCNTHRSDCNDK